MGRKEHWQFTCFLAALVCLSGMLAVFLAFTFPVNQATGSWNGLPENWLELRNQWEYSHAFNFVLALCAMSALTWAASVEE